MQSVLITKKINYPIFLFCLGFVLILLIPILPIKSSIELFNHNWRPEIMTSFVLAASLIYLGFIYNKPISFTKFNSNEIRFIILPITLFIFWSGLSFFWAGSWKSVFHHTAVWFCYLAFYLLIRQFFNQKSALNTSLYFLIAFVLMIGLPPIMEYASFVVFGNATTLGMRYSIYAELVNCLIPLLTVFVLRLKGRIYYLGIFSVLTAYLFIISSLSRSAFFLMIFSLSLLTFTIFFVRSFQKYRRRMAAIWGLFIFCAIGLHTIPLFVNSIFPSESEAEANVPLVERLKANEANISSNQIRPFFVSISFEMLRSNPFGGIGANNYGQEFNHFRENYSNENPNDKNLALAETEYAARTHNEYVQILAELGIIGGIIFAILLYGILKLNLSLIIKLKQPISINAVAACIGILIFLIASFVTSYSFRITQNGLCFFFLLAIAVRGLWKEKKSVRKSIYLSQQKLRPICFASVAICLIFASFLSVRVAGKYFSLEAIKTDDLEQSIPLHEWAVYLDDENADSHYFYAMQLFLKKKYAEAIPKLRESIKNGRTISPTYSYLATAQILTGDNEGAEETMKRAVNLYPYSVFARTRYSVILEKNAKTPLADREFQNAAAIDSKQAETWRSLIKDGARASTLKVRSSDKMIALMDLKPQLAIYAVLDERENLFPEEKFKFNY